MAFTKIAAAGIGSTGTVTLENLVVTGSINADSLTGAASTANVRTNSLVVSGVTTLGNTVVGGGTTQLIVNGNARITGILTIGTSSITLDGDVNQVNVGTGVTIHHTNGVQVGGNTVHSTGLTVNQINATGIVTASTFRVGTAVTVNSSGVTITGVITASSFRGDGSALTGIAATTDVRTNSLVVSGMTTATGGIQVGATTSIIIGNTFLRSNSIGIGTTTTTGRNAGVGTAIGTLIYNATTNVVEVYTDQGWVVVGQQQTTVTGGTVTSTSTTKIHTFTTSGTLDVKLAPPTFSIDYLVVGGGGGGNTGFAPFAGFGGGGGGAGGFRAASGTSIASGTYEIRVGNGAPAPSWAPGQPSYIANPSVGFSSIVSEGGGAGTGVYSGGPYPGSNGGSGGGGGSWAYYNALGGLGNRVAGTTTPAPSQGNNGGNGSNSSGGGGGGGGGGGSNASGTTGGSGGAGSLSAISGSPVLYAGGGGGASGPGATHGSGGPGGGGSGSYSTPNPGSTNRGGGGGGTSNSVAGDGGPGIVIVAYPIASVI